MRLALTTFVIASALLVVLPGPDTLVILRSIVVGGRTRALRTVAGTCTGLVVWVAVAVLGLAAVLRASQDAYLALRVVGGAYLVWMGVQAFRSRGQEPLALDTGGGALLRTGYVAGLATDLLNPKVGVFFVTFLPGFVPAGLSVPLTSLAFGGIFILETLVYGLVLIALSGPVVRWLGTPSVRRRLDVLMGGVFVAFGIRLATES